MSHSDRIFIPNGQEWGGVTDRFSVFHSKIAETVLSLTADLVTNASWWFNAMVNRKPCNVETVLYLYFKQRRGLPIQKFDHVAFTIRRMNEDPTKWFHLGDTNKPPLQEYGGDLAAKYGYEVDAAGQTCNPWMQLRYYNKRAPLHVTSQ
jgi:hypothetical protein